MDSMDSMDTPETPEVGGTPTAVDAASTPRRARRWGRSAAIAGVSALALIGAGTVGALAIAGPRVEAVRDARMGIAEGPAHARVAGQRGPAAMRAQGDHGGAAHGTGRSQAPGGLRGMGDPAARMADREEQRAARLAELATELGLDPAALTEAVEALHEEMDGARAALREELTDATREERRDAMFALREDRQARMHALLSGLGADADAVDALLAEHAGSNAGRFGRAGAMSGRSL